MMLYARYSLVVCCCLVLSACVALPQPQKRQQTVLELLSEESWQTSNLPSLKSQSSGYDGVSLRQSLLDLFANQELNAIVDQALANNLDLRLAAERLQEAGFLVGISRADKLPTIGLDVAVNRSKTNDLTIDEGQRRTDYSGNITIAWELDLWGRLHQQHESQQAKHEALLHDYAAVQNSIAARAMQLWFDVISQSQIVDIQQQRTQQLERLSTLSEQRYLSGDASLHELHDVRGKHAQALATMLEQQQQLVQRNYQLQALLGSYPKRPEESNLEKRSLINESLTISLPPIAVGIPAYVIHQRPDIKAAWQSVVAANASAEADYWAMYPSIELTGQFSKNGSSLQRLMDQPSIWNLLSMIKIPLFNAGRLKNNYQVANSRAEQDYVVFLQHVLNAFHEIETVLNEQVNLAQQEQALRVAVNYSSDNALRAELDYRFGKIDLEEYLDRQIYAFDLLIQSVELNNKRLQNRVALGLAIGQGV